MTSNFCYFLSLVFILALVGNVLVVVTVVVSPAMHNVINFYIVNLAVADIFVAILCIPMTLLDSLYMGKYALMSTFNFIY